MVGNTYPFRGIAIGIIVSVPIWIALVSAVIAFTESTHVAERSKIMNKYAVATEIRQKSSEKYSPAGAESQQ